MKQLIVILVLSAGINTSITAQNKQGNCITKLKALTEKQVQKLNELQKEHQKMMADFRTERRSRNNLLEKDKVRAKMLAQKEKHHLQVKKVLTAEQWTEFLVLHETGNRNSTRGDRYGRRGFSYHRQYGEKGRKPYGNCVYSQKRGCKDVYCKSRFTGKNRRKFSTIDTSAYQNDNFKIEEF